MKPGSAMIVWTLAITGGLALLVAGAGVIAARQVTYERLPDGGARGEEAFRAMVAQVDGLEARWVEALRGLSAELLEAWPDSLEGVPRVAGVREISLIDPVSREPRRLGWEQTAVRPKLGRFVEEDEQAWALPDSVVSANPGFVEDEGRPPAYIAGNGRRAVVMVLDPDAAARVAAREIDIAGGDGDAALVWLGPEGGELARAGDVPAGRAADESLRHLSRFGPWTVRSWAPVVARTNYRKSWLAGSLSISGVMMLGGLGLAVSQRRAMKLAERQVSFVNQVSHELRTPLTNLLLNTDLALDSLQVGDERARRRLGLIREETGRLSRVVDNVLAFAGPGQRRFDRRPASCDLARVIGSVSESFRPLFERRGMRCETVCLAAIEMVTDADALAQILGNLLSNAEKFAGDGARVAIEATVVPDAVVIEISDDGPGVPRGFQRRMFRPFTRASRAANEGTSGTGLGLAISRELAENLGGTLEFVAGERGARFRLTLPETVTEGRPG